MTSTTLAIHEKMYVVLLRDGSSYIVDQSGRNAIRQQTQQNIALIAIGDELVSPREIVRVRAAVPEDVYLKGIKPAIRQLVRERAARFTESLRQIPSEELYRKWIDMAERGERLA